MKKKTEPNLNTHSFDEIVKGILTVKKEDADKAVKRPNQRLNTTVEPKKNTQKHP
ncbi:MAG: hypothetical protein KA797_00175 [Chitinophagales bacterium]|nr:hypothetical protein [Chitinophagales bacterium]